MVFAYSHLKNEIRSKEKIDMSYMTQFPRNLHHIELVSACFLPRDTQPAQLRRTIPKVMNLFILGKSRRVMIDWLSGNVIHLKRMQLL